MPGERQDRRIRELEQKKADRKDEKATILEHNPVADPLWVGRMVIGRITGPRELNVGGMDPDEGRDEADASRRSQQKGVSDRKEITDDARYPGRREAADLGEALIAAEPRRIRPSPS